MFRQKKKLKNMIKKTSQKFLDTTSAFYKEDSKVAKKKKK